jgi:dihydrofolate reductase
MRINVIIAISKNGIMGIDNKLPWTLKDDLKHFKSITNGYPVIMGSKTFESLPGILPNREHIVLSKVLYSDENKSVFDSIEEALNYCKESEYGEVYVIGGANVIKQFAELNIIDEFIITHVDCTVDGDTYLDLDEDLNIYNYTIYKREKHLASERNMYNFEICHYIKTPKRFYQ